MRPFNPQRRHSLALAAATCLPGAALAAPVAPLSTPLLVPLDPPDPIHPQRPLRFPRDHGAHPNARIEWWYLTGTLRLATPDQAGSSAGPVAGPTTGLLGFQITFFRSRTGLAEPPARWPGRFAPRQLLFAHAALTDLSQQPPRHQHDQRLQRWNGAEPAPGPLDLQAQLAAAARADTAVHLGPWFLQRQPDGRYRTQVQARSTEGGFRLDLTLQPTQPLLLQAAGPGEGRSQPGYSRKGPLPGQASHYYSQPQLAAQGQLQRGSGPAQPVSGTAWLDHEWSDTLMPPDAAGWDWLGINLFDGSALTAFRLRRADPAGAVSGSGAAAQAQAGLLAAPSADPQAVWAGGSHRAGQAGAPVRSFAAHEVQLQPLPNAPHWTSPRTGARYPLRWQLRCPAGHFHLHALLPDQELDTAASTGAVYWEGLAELRHPDTGQALGLGYLEMTGYSRRLRL